MNHLTFIQKQKKMKPNQQDFFCNELVFLKTEEIAPGIERFLFGVGADEVVSIMNFITAVQAPPSLANPGTPGIQYQFRIVITYTVKHED
jgi:hypothetical protein